MQRKVILRVFIVFRILSCSMLAVHEDFNIGDFIRLNLLNINLLFLSHLICVFRVIGFVDS